LITKKAEPVEEKKAQPEIQIMVNIPNDLLASEQSEPGLIDTKSEKPIGQHRHNIKIKLPESKDPEQTYAELLYKNA